MVHGSRLRVHGRTRPGGSGNQCTNSRATVEVRCKNYSVVTSETSVAYVNGVSEAIFKVGMCLPAGPYVSDDDVKYIVDTVKANIVR